MGSEIVAEVSTVTNGLPEQVGEGVATIFNNLGASLEGSVKEPLSRIPEPVVRTPKISAHRPRAAPAWRLHPSE